MSTMLGNKRIESYWVMMGMHLKNINMNSMGNGFSLKRDHY